MGRREGELNDFLADGSRWLAKSERLKFVDVCRCVCLCVHVCVYVCIYESI